MLGRYKKNIELIGGIEKKVFTELTEDGISVISIKELFGAGNHEFEKLGTWLKNNMGRVYMGEYKPFLMYYYGGNYETKKYKFDSNNPFHLLANTQIIKNIVQAYIKCETRLHHLELSQSIPRDVGADNELLLSQNWHRDPGVGRIVKVFIYMSDVELDDGPFTYLKKSRSYEEYGNLLRQKYFGLGGRYDRKNLELKGVINKEDIKICSGQAGTIIFADTTAIHKGGDSRRNSRIMSTFAYFNSHNYSKPTFILEQNS